MRKFISGIILVLTLVTLLPSNTNTVYAYGSDEELISMYSALIVSGLSPIAASALMGNIQGECSYNPTTVQSGGAGIGLFQWSTDSNRSGLETFSATSDHDTHTKMSLNGYYVCVEPACQMVYGLIYTEERLQGYKWSSYYNERAAVLSEAKAAISAGIIPASVTITNNYDYWATEEDNLADAVIQSYADVFTAGATKWLWVGNSGLSSSLGIFDDVGNGYDRRYTAACYVYELCSGLSVDDIAENNDTELSMELAIAMYNTYGWSDEQLESYVTMTEINVDDLLSDATYANLTEEQASSYNDWSDNLAFEENIVMKSMKYLMIFVGIGLILWSVFFYVGYWFDRVNNFLALNVVEFLTLGKLCLSETEDSCTYISGGQDGVRTVNHRAALTISIVAILVGTFVVSGALYTLMMYIILTVKTYFGG